MRIAGAALSFASGGCLVMALALGGEDAAVVPAETVPLPPAGTAAEAAAIVAGTDIAEPEDELSAAEQTISELS